MLKELTREELEDHIDQTPAASGASQDGLGDVYSDALEVARRVAPDGPVFCFSRNAFARRLKLFQDGFPGRVTYAVKANPSPEIISTLADLCMTAFDVASPVEMELVRKFSPRATLHYHNPIKSRAEITQAYRAFGVRHFAVDDKVEIEKIGTIVRARADVELVIRFRAAKNRAVCDFSTKFGADMAYATELLQLANGLGFKTALTFHPGSQCLDPVSYAENIKAAADISRRAGVAVRHLNVAAASP